MATTTACVLDALARYPQRLRGVAITDTRIAPATLRDWHTIGMRGLRFHLFPQKPGYVRGVGLDVFEVFRETMAELGWVMQVFCDPGMMQDLAPTLREIAREMPVIVDHTCCHAGRARRERSEFPGAAQAGGRRACARESFGALSGLRRNFRTMPTCGRSTTRWCAPIRSG